MKGISTIKIAFLSDFKHIDFFSGIRYMRNKNDKWRLFRSWASAIDKWNLKITPEAI